MQTQAQLLTNITFQKSYISNYNYGNILYQNGEYEYNFTVSGTLDNFEGCETIHKGKVKVYELKCHGGIIKR